MDDFEFACSFQEKLERYLQNTSDEDYSLNVSQAFAFAAIVYQVQKMVKENNGNMEPIQFIPRLCCASITATLPLVDLVGGDLQIFSSILKYASAFTVEALTDGNVCISLNVPDVFLRKD